MTVFQTTLQLQSHGGTPSYIDVTTEVKEAIAASGITSGTVTVVSARFVARMTRRPAVGLIAASCASASRPP